MNVESEQLTKNGLIELAKEEKMTRAETTDILKSIFGNELSIETINDRNVFVVLNGDKKVILLTSQISYLGNPHPIFKKRVQLKNWFMDIIEFTRTNFEYSALLIGIYRYKDNIVFVDFDKEKYAQRKMHNSSAHVFINDLYQGMIHEKFSKRDMNGNLITCISSSEFKSYVLGNSVVKDNISEILELVDLFNKKNFKFNDWIEVDKAILEMKKANFKKWKECEWPGFYLEHKYDQFTNEDKISEIIMYQNNEKKNVKQLDFDLKFPRANFYGDLKSSSLNELSTMLNDASNVEYELNHFGKLWYLIYEHETVKDKDIPGNPYTKKRLEVIRLYEPDYKKGYDDSYLSRLKAKVNYQKMFIVEINKINYTSLLAKMTSNFHLPNHGNLRAPKFKLDKQNIQNAIIYSYSPAF